MKQFYTISLFILLNLLLVNGCSNSDSSSHPLILRAENAKAAGDYDDAAKYLQRLVDQKPDSYTAHLALAELYDNQLKSPYKAVYHYERALELKPDLTDAEIYRKLSLAARKKTIEIWLSEVNNTPTSTAAASYNDLSRKVTLLEQENALLRSRLSAQTPTTTIPTLVEATAPQTQVEQQPPRQTNSEARSVRTATTPQSAPQPNNVERSYTVVSGDNPAKISQKMYGTTRHWRLIMDANKATVPSEKSLRVGQKLVIPPLVDSETP